MHLSENWARISPAMDNHRNDDINAACDRLEQRERAAQAADLNGSIEKQTTNTDSIPQITMVCGLCGQPKVTHCQECGLYLCEECGVERKGVAFCSENCERTDYYERQLANLKDERDR